jgi:hypothetical protein
MDHAPTGGLKVGVCGLQQWLVVRRFLPLVLAFVFLPFARAEPRQSGWSMGVYGGQYYDSEPAGFIEGRANYLNQHLLALTASKTVWRSPTLPVAVELDAMLGQQWGLASLQEIAVAPVLRWSSFPWNALLQTDLRLGPLGVSYTTEVGPLERGSGGQGSRWLNFLMVELAVSRPEQPSEEVFIRLHHRCAIYDLVNNYGANGEDFLAFGYRHRF